MVPVSDLRPYRKLFDLLLIATGFALAHFLYAILLQGGLTVRDHVVASLVSIFIFWLAIQFRDKRAAGVESTAIVFFDVFCLGTGADLLLHSLLTYVFFSRRTSFLIVAGGLFSALFMALCSRWLSRREERGTRILLVGYDAIAPRILNSFGQSIMGMVGDWSPAVPEDIPVLGSFEQFGEVIARYRPTHLVVGQDGWLSSVSPASLLSCKLSGIVVEETSGIYERLFQRISCERLQPMDLLLSSALRGESRMMAIQAVYTNLIGLFFLIALSPILAAVSLLSICFGGAGRVFETVECAGFQYIPFRMLRFRTHGSDGTGKLTALGAALLRMRLSDLPQLINVVRGEMALVGPRPVRRQFAAHLTELMPFYSHRFSVKPGIFGWAQMHVPKGESSKGECLHIEYDLYYIKQGSPWLDGEILIGTLLGAGRKAGTAAAGAV